MWIYLSCLTDSTSSAESEESASHLESGLDPSHIVKSTPIVKECSSHEWILEMWNTPLSGTISGHFEGAIYTKQSILSMEVSPARISVSQGLEKAWKESEADFSSRSCAWPKKSSPSSYSLKTFLQLQHAGDFKSLTKLPRWGMIVDGVLYPLKASVQNIRDRDGSFWPTPKARDAKAAGMKSESKRDNPSLPFRVWEKTGGRKMNLPWLEWLMRYPAGWTELSPWVIPWFRSKRKRPLKS